MKMYETIIVVRMLPGEPRKKKKNSYFPLNPGLFNRDLYHDIYYNLHLSG